MSMEASRDGDACAELDDGDKRGWGTRRCNRGSGRGERRARRERTHKGGRRIGWVGAFFLEALTEGRTSRGLSCQIGRFRLATSGGSGSLHRAVGVRPAQQLGRCAGADHCPNLFLLHHKQHRRLQP
ncbi:hypothetical protein VPH35_037456 [Triticum aestivum]